MVYNGLQSTFVSLAWLWSGRSLSLGETVRVLGPWTWAQCGQAPCPHTTNYLTNLQPDRLIFCHMAGWLANCSWQTGWLADCLLNKMSTWPSPGRDIFWPCVWLLWSHRPVVRCIPTPLERHLVAKWEPPWPPWDCRPGWHLVRCQIRSTSCQMPPTVKKSSRQGKMIDPPGQLLHHERPFTRKGKYLVQPFILRLSH